MRTLIIKRAACRWLCYGIFSALLLCLCSNFTNAQTVKMYGDAGYNTLYYPQVHNNHIYALGNNSTNINARQSHFVKMDMSGNVIWQARLESGTSINDFATDGRGNFVLTGRTGNQQRSIVWKLVDTGNSFTTDCIKYYRLAGGRQGFNYVKYRANTSDYLLHGIDLAGGDDISLHTLDRNCNISSSRKYEGNFDHQFAAGFMQDVWSRWTMMGDNGSNGHGIFVTVNGGLNYQEAFELRPSVGGRSVLRRGVLDGNNKIMVGNAGGRTRGIIMEVAPGGNLQWAMEIPQSSYLIDIHKGATNGNVTSYYIMGETVVSGKTRWVMYKLNKQARQTPTLVWTKMLDQNESEFLGGYPTYDQSSGRIVYTDGRKGNANGFGDMDALVAIVDGDLNSCMTEKLEHNLQEFELRLVRVGLETVRLEVPEYIKGENIEALKLDNANLCPSPSVCDNGQLCDATSELNVSTGTDGNGNLLSTGTVDPFWQLINCPPTTTPSTCTPPDMHIITPYQNNWNTIAGAGILNVVPGNGSFGANNLDRSQPWRIRREFCVCTATEVCIEGIIRADDRGALRLYDDNNPLAPPIMTLATTPAAGFNTDTPFKRTLALPTGTYHLEFEMLNTQSVAMGYAVQTDIRDITGRNTILNSNPEESCCGRGTLSIQKLLDKDCDENTPPTLGNAGWQFQIVNTATGQSYTGTTNSFGELILRQLPFGTYTITETVNSPWQAIGGATRTITIDATNSVQYVEFINQNTENCPCAIADDIKVTCTATNGIYAVNLPLLNNSGMGGLAADITILSPFGTAFSGCTSNVMTVPSIGTGIQNISFDIEDCTNSLSTGATVTLKITLRDPKSNWCCHLEDIRLIIPECDTSGICDGENLVKNGDFEGGNWAFTSSLPQKCYCASASYCIQANARDKCNNSLWRNITSSGKYMIIDGASGNFSVVWEQGISVTAGTSYEFGFDHYPNVSGGDAPTLVVQINGATVSPNWKGTKDTWNTFSDTWTAPSSGSVSVRIVQTQAGNQYNDYGIDNVVFKPCSSNIDGAVERRGTEMKEAISLTNFPNPFRNSTTIAFTLPQDMQASLRVFDMKGREVFEQTAEFQVGENRIELDATTLQSAGLYYYRLETANQVITKSMMLIAQ